MLKAYFDFIMPDNIDHLQQCVWNNHRICINPKPFYYKHFSKCGMNMISDLYYTNGNIILFNAVPTKMNLLFWF